MVQAKDISFVERKSLPTVCLLNTTFGIKYNSNSQQFDTQNYEIELNGFIQILAGGTYFYLSSFRIIMKWILPNSERNLTKS